MRDGKFAEREEGGSMLWNEPHMQALLMKII